MKWGVFKQKQSITGEIHVIPCYPDAKIAPGHIVDVLCSCRPEGEKGLGNNIIIVHNHKE